MVSTVSVVWPHLPLVPKSFAHSPDYSLLSVILTGRALESHAKMFGVGSSALTHEDWLAVRSTFLNLDEVMKILRALPTSLILILRNLNIVRSLNRELGCPVNRFNIMARRSVGNADSATMLISLMQCH